MTMFLSIINKKKYNIFESIQLLYDMDCYGNMDNIFKELKDIMPDTIHISTEGIEDEKILFFLNHLNGCSLEVSESFKYFINFIKDDKSLFGWNLRNDNFWIDYDKIWKVFEVKYDMINQEIQDFTKHILEQYCKLMGVTPLEEIVP